MPLALPEAGDREIIIADSVRRLMTAVLTAKGLRAEQQFRACIYGPRSDGALKRHIARPLGKPGEQQDGPLAAAYAGGVYLTAGHIPSLARRSNIFHRATL